MQVKVGALVRSFAPNRQLGCVPHLKPMGMRLMAAAIVVDDTIPDLKLPFMQAAVNLHSPPRREAITHRIVISCRCRQDPRRAGSVDRR